MVVHEAQACFEPDHMTKKDVKQENQMIHTGGQARYRGAKGRFWPSRVGLADPFRPEATAPQRG
jgi:thiamine biosynthesis lipoprotein ApbE